MALVPGTRLGPYEILAALGVGGMGEVYRATDTRLKRQVAIKVLPSSLAVDADRLARFQREAEVLASLNHPNIAQLHGLEDANGVQALVMELVEGDDLSERLAHGALPLDDALQIARQIADALEAAHEQGIIHRDLKPANIKVRPDGTVKVLDFGLAKAMAPQASTPEIAQSPTITTPAMTQAGMILGTAAYMSPEQAKGRVADKRSDIWSFGCVVFEMLSGRRPFEGEDVSDTLAAILRGEPDWALLPSALPQPVRALVQGCLKKDRRRRIGDIAVAQFLLNGIGAAAMDVVSRAPTSSSRRWQAAAAVLAIIAAGAISTAAYWYQGRPAAEVTQFLITPREKSVFVTAGRTGTSVAISPDGRRLAYTTRDETGRVLIWIRPLADQAAHSLEGTDDAEFPFWSPDSRSIAYFANGKLLKIDAAGGLPQVLCDAENARGGAWGPEGVIVFGGGTGKGLLQLPAAGGTPVALTKSPDDGDHRFPSFLPDGRHVLFHANWPSGSTDNAGLHVVALARGQPTRIAASDTGGVYTNGVVLFARQTTLVAQPFDLARLSFSGEPTPIAEHVESGVFGGVLAFSVSNTGILAYGIGTGRENALALTWFDRGGKALGTVGPPGNYLGLDLSPDEKQVAVHRHDSGFGGDIWLIDIGRGTTSRFTFDPAQDNSAPIWAPDGKRIAFASFRSGAFRLFIKPADGAGVEELIQQPASHAAPRSWSPDGKLLIYGSSEAVLNRSDVWMVPIAGEQKPVPVLTTPFSERNPQVSPDGQWLGYSSDETGRPEIYVRPFPSGPGRWQVSTSGGVELRWRSDSKELFYLERTVLGSVMAVDVNVTGRAFSISSPRRLFDWTNVTSAHPGVPGMRRFAVTKDGQRFLVATNPRARTFSDSTSSPIAVVVNWAASLKK